jgi:hypothetical protein
MGTWALVRFLHVAAFTVAAVHAGARLAAA